MIAFELLDNSGKQSKEAAFTFLNALDLVDISNNLGDSKSLITHPETTTHQRLTPEARETLGIGSGLVRLSVGLEDPDDLMEDMAAALDQIPA
jgi:O-succinylhomoserine sulfhydrylase